MLAVWRVLASGLTLAAVALVVSVLAHAACLFVVSLQGPPRRPRSAAQGIRPRVVFVIPCLNEERVIAGGIVRLLTLPYDDLAVLVVDDGSDDGTAAIVEGFDDPRVHLLRRRLPEARQGKGEALNAAYRHVVESGLTGDRRPDEVVLAVVDADGRLEDRVLAEVLPHFADRDVAGVQTAVRINNRHVNPLARLQDVEFVIFTDVYQQARNYLGSVCLGGNGQFMRLSALDDLHPQPWSSSLTEDLDLGLRLIARGWRNVYCSRTAVHQQGVTELGRLVRQRTRWFQGHLQSWGLLPEIARSTRGRARLDLLYHVTAPYLLLCSSLLTVSFVAGIGSRLLSRAPVQAIATDMAGAYLLGIVPVILLVQVYWLRERHDGLSRPGSIALAHGYVFYALLWYAAGWRAIGRVLLDRTGWVKTTREMEAPADPRPQGVTPPTRSGASVVPLPAEPLVARAEWGKS